MSGGFFFHESLLSLSNAYHEDRSTDFRQPEVGSKCNDLHLAGEPIISTVKCVHRNTLSNVLILIDPLLPTHQAWILRYCRHIELRLCCSKYFLMIRFLTRRHNFYTFPGRSREGSAEIGITTHHFDWVKSILNAGQANYGWCRMSVAKEPSCPTTKSRWENIIKFQSLAIQLIALVDND